MTNEERERAVERVDGFVQRWGARIGFGAQTSDLIYAVTVHGFDGEAELCASDLRALLSERAELLAAVERMRGTLEEADRRLSRPDWTVQRDVTRMAIRAALTTGEGK